jgi:two-component system, cell cycle response regulator
MRILIADDDPVSRLVLKTALVRLGHDVVEVSNGTLAEAALCEKDGPQLAILDWMMPGKDGLSVCRALRQRPGAYIYIVLLTARDRRGDMLAGLDAGADDFLTKPLDVLELRACVRSGERVIELQASLLEAQEVLRVEATHDRLTGLWNRGAILDQLAHEAERMARLEQPLAVAIADIDHFKQINDAYGHLTGDAVLRTTSQRIRGAIRAYDHLGRYGGEEFLLVLPDADVESATCVAERVRRAVAAEPIRLEAGVVQVTLSIGVASVRRHGPDLDALIHAADEALYRAKARGRNRVEAQWPESPSRPVSDLVAS